MASWMSLNIFKNVRNSGPKCHFMILQINHHPLAMLAVCFTLVVFIGAWVLNLMNVVRRNNVTKCGVYRYTCMIMFESFTHQTQKFQNTLNRHQGQIYLCQDPAPVVGFYGILSANSLPKFVVNAAMAGVGIEKVFRSKFHQPACRAMKFSCFL